MQDGKTPGEIIRAWRRSVGWSQFRLANELGRKNQSTVSEYEADLKMPPKDAREKLAELSGGLVPLSLWEGMTRSAARRAPVEEAS